jgi:hypothetical protein
LRYDEFALAGAPTLFAGFQPPCDGPHLGSKDYETQRKRFCHSDFSD